MSFKTNYGTKFIKLICPKDILLGALSFLLSRPVTHLVHYEAKKYDKGASELLSS